MSGPDPHPEPRTTLVYIRVSRAAWWPPEKEFSGIAVATDPEQARGILDRYDLYTCIDTLEAAS